MGTGAEGHGTSYLLLGNISNMYPSMKNVLSRTSTDQSSSTPNQTRTLKSRSCKNRRAVSSHKIGPFLPVRKHDNFCCLIISSHSLSKKTLLTRLKPVPISRRHVCGWSCWSLVSRLCRSFTLAFSSGCYLKNTFSAKIAGGGGCCIEDGFFFESFFEYFGNSNVICLEVSEDSPSVVWWGFLWEGPPAFFSRLFFFIGKVVPMVLNPLLLRIYIVSLTSCGVMSSWRGPAMWAIVIGVLSIWSLNAVVPSYSAFSLLFRWDERAVMYRNRFPEA